MRYALIALALAAACGGGEPDVLIPDTTVVLDDETLAALEEVSPDRATFRFARATPLLDRLAEADVIVADVYQPHLPAGALRRVRSIDRSDGVVVTTDPASLAEAIERGSIRERVELREQGVQARRVRPGVNPEISATGLYFGLNDVVLFDGDGDPDPDDQVVMNGNIAIEPSLDIVIDLDGFSLEEASIAIVGEVSGNVNIDARREATLPGVPIELASISLGTYTFFVGPVPVVINSYVDLEVGVDGKVTAAMNVGFQTDAEARIGFGYQDGSFETIGEIVPTASVELPSFSDGAVGTARLFAGPRLVVGLYGVPVGFARLETYVQAEVDVGADPWWCLSAGMEGTAGIDIDIDIDFWIFDIEIEVIEWETPPIGDSVELGCADGPAPSQVPGSGGGGEEAIATFARSYGGDNLDGFTAILPTDDGGALIAGSTNSFSPTPRDAWLVKVDALGHVGWQLAYADLDGATDLVDMGDGYLVTAGRLGATVDTIDLLRIDENGQLRWARRYRHPDGVGPARVVPAADGGFLVAGTLSMSSGADFFAARFDADGEVVWATSYGGADGDAAWAAAATSDGGFLLVGTTSSFGVTFDAIWAVKLDGDGGIEWQRLFDQGGVGSGYIAVESPLGGYLIGGHVVGAGLLLRLTPGGEVTWARYYDAGSDNDYLMAAAAYPDGSFGAVGSRGLGDGSDLWALRVSDPGNVLWSRAIGGGNHESAGASPPSDRAGQPVAISADGGLFAAGKTETWGTGYHDAWLLKLTHNGFVELDTDAGATSTALAGSLSTIDLPGAATSVTAVDVALAEEPLEVDLASTPAAVLRQGGPP